MLINIHRVAALTSISKPTIYRLLKSGNFPKQKQISPRRVGWLEADILNWILSK